MTSRCRIFISYAHADEALKDSKVKQGIGYPSAFLSNLETSLPPLKGRITKDEVFFDRKRLASEPVWSAAIERALGECELFIFLVSVNSLASDYCIGQELARAVKRGVPVIPVLLRPKGSWIHHPVPDPDDSSAPVLGELGQFHSGGLPKDGGGNAKAVSTWSNEDEAWDEVCKDLLQFIRDNIPERDSGQAPVKASALSAGDQAPKGATEIQDMLAFHLNNRWAAFEGLVAFKEAEVFSSLPRPLTPKAVFCLSTESKPVSFLIKLRGFVGKRNDGRSAIAQLSGNADLLEVVLLLTLTAAERFIQSKSNVLALERHETLGGDDSRLTAVLAAAGFGFGIKLRPSLREPDNFVRLSGEELGHEQGYKNARLDLYAAANRLTLENPPAVAEDEVQDEEVLSEILDYAKEKLGCRLVLLTHGSSPLRDNAVRGAVLGGLDVPILFEGVPKESVRNVLSTLKALVGPLLDGMLGPLPAEPTNKSDPPIHSDGSAP